jgi:Na+/H+-dicarboxylate symporter
MRLALHWQILIALVLGAAVGLWLNMGYGRQRMPQAVTISPETVQLMNMERPAEVPAGSVWVEDTPEQILIQIVVDATAERPVGVRRVVVRPLADVGEANWPPLPAGVPAESVETLVVSSLDQLKAKEPAAFVLHSIHGSSTARWIAGKADLAGGLFLRMLKMVSVPLIITSLVAGVTGLGHLERLGKMFGRTFAYYITTSMLAIITGLCLVNLIQPGVAPAARQIEAGAVDAEGGSAGKSVGAILFEQLENLIPLNPLEAAAAGNFLSIIAFSLLFAVFIIAVGGTAQQRLGELFQSAFDVMMRMTMAIIQLAPWGVFFLMLAAVAGQGLGIFAYLGLYMVTVALGLAVHALVTLPLFVHFLGRRSPLGFSRAVSPALLTAFSSASSNAALPLTMTCVEERAGISNRVGSFVLPLGATINMDGTALYEAVAVLFIAQLSGIDLSIAQQVLVAITALLVSIGAAGIPHAGLVMMIIILQAVGLPTEKQGMIIAVDRMLDMTRTMVNVWSDCCGCAVISRFEVSSVTDEEPARPEADSLDAPT